LFDFPSSTDTLYDRRGGIYGERGPCRTIGLLSKLVLKIYPVVYEDTPLPLSLSLSALLLIRMF